MQKLWISADCGKKVKYFGSVYAAVLCFLSTEYRVTDISFQPALNRISEGKPDSGPRTSGNSESGP